MSAIVMFFHYLQKTRYAEHVKFVILPFCWFTTIWLLVVFCCFVWHVFNLLPSKI